MVSDKALAALWRIVFYLLSPNEPFIMRTRDYRLYADPRRDTLTRAVIRRGFWERLQTEAFIGFLAPGALVIDAGANFGHYALTAARFVGRDGLVIAFEPHARTFDLLARNVDLQPHGNVVAERAGLGAEETTLPLTTDFGMSGLCTR